MCLVVFAIQASGRWPLVIASNRDESFDRPTLPLQRWQGFSGQTIISGRDERAGGTWLGVTLSGRVAFLTNVRERPGLSGLPAAAPRSRGELVTGWLDGNQNVDQFMADKDCAAYGGFNLVVGDWHRNEWSWLSNRPLLPSSRHADVNHGLLAGWAFKPLTPGIYGLSNASLDTPWPKTLALKAALSEALQNAEEAGDSAAIQKSLWSALASRKPVAELRLLPDTGVPLEMEKALSSAFIDMPGRAYGTRCSTLLLAEVAVSGMQSHQALQMHEKTYVRSAGIPASGNCTESFASETLIWPEPGIGG